MTNVRENLAVMDNITTFGKQNLISVSKSVAAFLTLIILGCIIATGLIVYHFSACTAPQITTSTIDQGVTCDNYFTSTTVKTTISKSQHETVTSTTILEDGSISTTEIAKTEKKLDVRLPRSIVPIYYRIDLIPFIVEGNFTFHGNVTILVNVTETCNNITLHADDLTISTVEVISNNKKRHIDVKQLTNDSEKHFVVIHLNENLETGGLYNISIIYTGVLSDLLRGFYRSSYYEGNTTRWIAVTQFQTTDARRAFPCFDEPALKAKFQLNIARFKNMTSISNMPKVSTTDYIAGLADYEWDHFQESVPMSTYLLAFTVCDFVNLTKGTFSVWARKSAISQAQFSLDIGPKILNYYEEFFGIKYPLPKTDMIAVPDFQAGAMENWGLITFRESLLLYEEGISGKGYLQKIAQVVAHELAHQWFGNLVTPVWWSDLWLNEGFANYVEYLGTNEIYPEWKVLDQFVVNEVQSSLKLDALKSSHQISVEVNDPDEINNIFDRISYSKGASIIRMMQNFLTAPVFQRGLTKYLLKGMYKNAEQDDLWKTLTEQSHEENILPTNMTVKEIMDTWTLQTGFPIVNVIRNYDDKSVTFHQQRYMLDKNDNSTKHCLWWIPITYTEKNHDVKSTWMDLQSRKHLKNANISDDSWLIVNVNFTGYYRVNYDLKNWDLIIKQLNQPTGHLAFDSKNRAQLLDDVFSLADSGYLNYDVALNVTKYLYQEREFVPLNAALTNLNFLYVMFVKTAHFDKFKAYMLKLINPFYNETGFKESPDDDLLTIYSRYELTEKACSYGNRDCLINCVQQFENWKSSVDPDRYNPISPNQREVVYCYAISVSGQEEWDFLWRRYLNANVGTEKAFILNALGCSKEIWILSRYLEWAITENSGIRKQDTPSIFATVSNNDVGQALTYRFMKTNWERIRSYLGPSSLSLSSIVQASVVNLNTQDEVDDLKLFVTKNKDQLGIALKSTEQAIEQAEANVKWMSRNFKNIVTWLSEQVVNY